MLTFYPEFEAESPTEVEVLFLLDLSCSMKVSSSVVFFCLFVVFLQGGRLLSYVIYTGTVNVRLKVLGLCNFVRTLNGLISEVAYNRKNETRYNRAC